MWHCALLIVALQARDLASSLGALRGIPVEEMLTVPGDAALLLTNAKHDLRDLVAAAIASQPADGPQAAEGTQRAVIAALATEQVAIGCDHCGDGFDGISVLRITSPAGHPELVAVEAHFGIPCGSDAVLYIFRHDASWHLVFAREENGYTSIADGLGSFVWALSASDARGRFLIVTASIMPWCSSNWQGLRYRVDRVLPGDDDPVAIDRGEETIYLETEIELAATAHSYSIRFDGACIDGSIVVRPHILAYEVDGERAVRVDPVADSPRTFVEEWLAMSEADAARWSRLDGEDLAAWREELVKEDRFRSVGPIRRCDDGFWQVRLDDADLDPNSDEYVPYYFIVAEEADSYRLVDILEEPRHGCPDEFE